MLTFIALLAAQAAAQAPATDAAKDSASPAPACELKGISEVDLITLRVAMVDQLVSNTPRPTSAATTLRAIETKAAECNPGSDLTADKAAADAAVARFAANAIGEKLSADGVDRGKVDAVIAKTSPAILDAFAAKRFDAPGVAELGERVTAAAGKDASEATRKLLGAYTYNTARGTRAAPKPAGPVER